MAVLASSRQQSALSQCNGASLPPALQGVWRFTWAMSPASVLVPDKQAANSLRFRPTQQPTQVQAVWTCVCNCLVLSEMVLQVPTWFVSWSVLAGAVMCTPQLWQEAWGCRSQGPAVAHCKEGAYPGTQHTGHARSVTHARSVGGGVASTAAVKGALLCLRSQCC